MCYNATISLITYVVGLAGCARLAYMGLIAEALFYAWTIQMQLFEFMIHTNMACGAVNLAATKFGLIVNHLEPIALYTGICIQGRATKTVHRIAQVYSIVALFYSIGAWFSTGCTAVTAASYPHLHWIFNESVGSTVFYPFFVLILVLLSLYGLKNGRVHAIICSVSFVISHMLYGKLHSAGAMWCLSAALGPWLLDEMYHGTVQGWLGFFVATCAPYFIDQKIIYYKKDQKN